MPLWTGCKPKVFPASDSIAIFLDTTITHRLSDHELTVILENDSDFEHFYRKIRENTSAIDAVERVKLNKTKYSEAYDFYKLAFDSTYWKKDDEKWSKEWDTLYSAAYEALEIKNKANINVSFQGSHYGSDENYIKYNILSEIDCEAYLYVFFHPSMLDRGYNVEDWFTIKAGCYEWKHHRSFADCMWFVTNSNNYGGGDLRYSVQQIIYKGKTYDVAAVEGTPSKPDYLVMKRNNSLCNLNPQLYQLVFQSRHGE